MSRRIGIGVIGLGLASKPHLLALRDLAAQVDFVAAFAPSQARRDAFVKEYGYPVVDSPDALLNDRRVEAVIVLTPPHAHADVAVRAAKAGKHILLEKPIDVDLPRSLALVEAVEAANRTLGVVFQHRFRPGPAQLRELIRQKILGDLIDVSASIRWWRSAEYFAQPGRGMKVRDGGGVLLTQAIHTLDLMLSLAGPAASVFAHCRTSALRKIDTEDVACAVVRYASGAIGTIDATTTAYPGYPERIDLAGTGGTASIEAERLVVHRPGAPPIDIDGSTEGGGGADPMAFSHEPHRLLIADFLSAISAGRAPLASGRAALRVQALIDAIIASSHTGRPVEVVSVES